MNVFIVEITQHMQSCNLKKTKRNVQWCDAVIFTPQLLAVRRDVNHCTTVQPLLYARYLFFIEVLSISSNLQIFGMEKLNIFRRK